jgi:hypothetical protein
MKAPLKTVNAAAERFLKPAKEQTIVCTNKTQVDDEMKEGRW